MNLDNAKWKGLAAIVGGIVVLLVLSKLLGPIIQIVQTIILLAIIGGLIWFALQVNKVRNKK